MEIVLAKETKRIAEDMQLRDLKPLPTLKPVENMRLSIEAFANCLMIIEFLNNFKHILNIRMFNRRNYSNKNLFLFSS
jgi:hypothetical protein